jgi:hypothetical protein
LNAAIQRPATGLYQGARESGGNQQAGYRGSHIRGEHARLIPGQVAERASGGEANELMRAQAEDDSVADVEVRRNLVDDRHD